ncbi:DUF2309 domain-containing protein [Legionella hackeliae]|uniref:Probable inorganic carbon transporter subunit DabA n=1 Tax=Legionella hackeliae TaxID=449 RepID=A0A0A8URK3_LEGHA|nr:DUF2309 domain-containing protein [Legionella hackeliae]KTD13192.1 hypothetical protein Lhac_1061 [Legionella hackeliae]CEK11495.1 conserved protein of unknown function [Legionella hackeliae]STX48263.1 putative transmembrane protein [Legionella hackeliae]
MKSSALIKEREHYELLESQEVNFADNLAALIKECSKDIAPVWPMGTFIACNPLQSLEARYFEEALKIANSNRTKNGSNPFLNEVNLQMIKWCGSFLDAGQATIAIPHRDKAFYNGFLELACYDKQLHKNKKSLKNWIKNLPKNAEEAIPICLNRLGVRENQKVEFIKETFRYLPGWAGYVKWLTEWKNGTESSDKPITLIDFIAVRLIITCLIWPEAVKESKYEEVDTNYDNFIKNLKYNETVYRTELLNKLTSQLNKKDCHSKRADVQMVFCIDVRSEPFRRAFERCGNYQTLGFAGFFGLPIEVRDDEQAKECCPVLLKPSFQVERYLAPDSDKKACISNETAKTLTKIYPQLKYNFATAFSLVETLGLWYGLAMLLKTTMPNVFKRLATSFKKFLSSQTIRTGSNFKVTEIKNNEPISYKQKINLAETILKLMGLTSNFAKVVVFCGHGSTTENNPYSSSLDCGACGGNQGDINAKLLASILSENEVRRGLEDKGIHIPLDTQFFGALHNTTTDAVELYDQGQRIIYPNIVNTLKADLKKSQLMSHAERNLTLISSGGSVNFTYRSNDWSESRPEWGLARNASFIIAPRWLTKNLNLEGRCFLHSYEWEKDLDGVNLETILTAPLVVAQWINSQYLFSTLDNVTYGSGSKITHNVTGKIGVMQGNSSDLMHGLPLQSIMSTDKDLYHVPQRLLTVVLAQRHIVSLLIEKHDVLKNLFLNEWVHLIVIDPTNDQFYRFEKMGVWTELETNALLHGGDNELL